MLVVTRKRNQTIVIADDIEVTVLAASEEDDRVQLAISAPGEMRVTCIEKTPATRRAAPAPRQPAPAPAPVPEPLGGEELVLRRVLSALAQAGISTVAQWRAADERDLLLIPNLGLESLARMSRVLGPHAETAHDEQSLGELLGFAAPTAPGADAAPSPDGAEACAGALHRFVEMFGESPTATAYAEYRRAVDRSLPTARTIRGRLGAGSWNQALQAAHLAAVPGET